MENGFCPRNSGGTTAQITSYRLDQKYEFEVAYDS